MFAPSNHLGRSFGAPGTTRRARNNENSGVHLPTKTPIRAPLGGGGGGPFKPGPGTVGRPLGLKTVERNVLGSKSDHPVEDIGPKRLFQNTSKPSSSQAPLKPMKTPAATRHALRTPAPQRIPDPLPLPSAQRTRRRSRSSLSSQPAHSSPDHGFATPAPAHRWEEEVSLDSILEAADVEEASKDGEGSDYELEYAPPSAVDRPFIPEWAASIADPVDSLKTIATMRPLFFYDPPSPPPALQQVDLPTVNLCPEDDLEHPLLRRPKPKAAASATAKTGARTGTVSSPPGVGVTPRPFARPVTTVPPRTTSVPAPLKIARPASASAIKPAPKTATVSSRTTSRPATAMAAPVRARSFTTTSRTTTASARPPIPSRVGSTSRPGTTTTRPIRGASAPVPTKPTSPVLAPVVVPALDEFDLDLDFLGPDPAMEKIETVVEEPSQAEDNVKAEEPSQAEDTVKAEEPVVEVIEGAAPVEAAVEPTEATAADTTALTAASELTIGETPLTEQTAPVPAPATTEPTRPKVTLTAPDMSAEITQDLDASFIRDVAGAVYTPLVIPAAGKLDVPAEFAQEPDIAPPFFDDSFDGETFELGPLSDIPDMPSPALDAAVGDADAASTTAESWADEDMSFTDDVLAAAMERCLDLGR